MVKTYGPMFSLDASGTIANAITFSKWKGRSYARQRVIPSNPKSVLQVSMRAMMKFLTQEWAGIGSTPKGTWDARAAASNISPFNAFIGCNQALWREFSAPSQTDPVPGTGTLPVAVLTGAVGGPAHVDVTLTITTPNDVWGVILFRSPTGTFTPSIANCIAVLPYVTAAAHVYTDSNLAAGNYYYDAKYFTKEGVLGPDEGEMMGTAT